MVYSTRRFVVCLTMCHFVLVLFSPFSIAITSLGEERANFSAFRTFVRFVLVWICRFPLPLGVTFSAEPKGQLTRTLVGSFGVTCRSKIAKKRSNRKSKMSANAFSLKIDFSHLLLN